MEIAEFMDQDILIFLDDRIDAPQAKKAAPMQTLFLVRDYDKELSEALNHHDISKAKEVLHALKDQFDECAPDTPDKQQLKALLAALYERFKDYLAAEHLTPEDAGLKQPETAAPAAKPVDVLSPMLEDIERCIDQGQVREAARLYKKARGQSTPETSLQLLALYRRIKQAIADAKRTTEQASAPEQAGPVSAAEMDRHLLLQLEREKRDLDRLLQRGDLYAAAQQYRAMRLLALQITDEKTRNEARAKMERIFAIINTLRSHAAYGENNLAKVIP